MGCLVACLLGAGGIRVRLLEKRRTLPAHSMAIGITPPSLRILSRLGLEEKYTAEGVEVRDCFIHGESGNLGRVSFREIPDERRFILSLQQANTIAILREALRDHPSVTLDLGVEVTEVLQHEGRATVRVRHDSGEASDVSAKYVIACDGARSAVRDMIGEKPRIREYDRHFVMGDFADASGLGAEAHLYFKADGSVESFPLPDGQRRWIVQRDSPVSDAPAGFVSEVVERRTGIKLPASEQINISTFTPRRFNCANYVHGRVILCGDSAHGMSPVGGQGMNTGFADAELLAEVLTAIMSRSADPEILRSVYQRYRRVAAQSAISRADWSMWLGTWRGRWASALRDFIIRHLMCRGLLARHMGPLYAMLTIPYNTKERVPLASLIPFTARPASS